MTSRATVWKTRPFGKLKTKLFREPMRHCRKWDSSGPTQTRYSLSVLPFLEHPARIEQSSKRASITNLQSHHTIRPVSPSVCLHAKIHSENRIESSGKQTFILIIQNKQRHKQQTFLAILWRKKTFVQWKFIHLLSGWIKLHILFL